MIRAVIIEDENYIALDLKAKIEAIDSEIKIIKTLNSVKVAKKWLLQNEEPDIIFMDIQLGDGKSFEILEHYKISCPLIFITAYDEFALRAFQVNGLDYLLKPVENDELRKAIDKCKVFIGNKSNYLNSQQGTLINMIGKDILSKPFKENFVVNHRGHWIPIKTSDIAVFVKDSIIYLYKYDGEKHHLDNNTLEEIESMIDPNQFYRVNRQFIVHLSAIKSVEMKENSKLRIHLKDKLSHFAIDMSREKAPPFKKWLNQ